MIHNPAARAQLAPAKPSNRPDPAHLHAIAILEKHPEDFRKARDAARHFDAARQIREIVKRHTDLAALAPREVHRGRKTVKLGLQGRVQWATELLIVALRKSENTR